VLSALRPASPVVPMVSRHCHIAYR
jgi:hypothetical protein